MIETWNGTPPAPERSGWHWLEDGDGLRPLLWRGGDWSEPMDRDSWKDGFALLAPRDLRGASYHGPVLMHPDVAAHFRLAVLFQTA